jgi:cysteine desulfurase
MLQRSLAAGSRALGRGALGRRAFSEAKIATATPTAAAVPANPSFSIAGSALDGRPAYLDGAATTPIDPRVLDAMLPWMTSLYGNAHSRTHAYGWESEAAVEEARAQVASLVGASSKEIVFTSGATESNNIAVY